MARPSAALVLLGIASFRLRPSSTLQLDEDFLIVEAKKVKPIQPFEKCGGANWKGGTCCMKGCACIEESEFYSGCKAPQGLTGCDADAVKDEVHAAKGRLEDSKNTVDEAESQVKAAEEQLDKAKDAHKKAEEAADEAIKIGKEKRKAKEEAIQKFGKKVNELQTSAEKDIAAVEKDANATRDKLEAEANEKKDKLEKAANHKKSEAATKAQEARTKADKTRSVLDLKTKEHAAVEAVVGKYNKEQEMRKTTKCGGVFADCSKTKCCALGCECKGKSTYYFQCGGIDGKEICDWKPETEKQNDRVAKMNKLAKEKSDFTKWTDSNEKTAQELEKKAAEAADEAKTGIPLAHKEAKEKIAAARKDAEQKINAVKKQWENKLEPARKERDTHTVAVRKAAAKAGTEREKAVAFAKKKAAAQTAAAKHLRESKEKLQKSKDKIGVAKRAVHTWARAAKGDTCAEHAKKD